MNERELTAKALNQLEFQTGLIARISEYAPLLEGAVKEKQRADAVIQFDNSSAKLIAELKKWSVDGATPAILDQIEQFTDGRDRILISEFINDEVGARLREAKYNYLDKAGNAYLDIAPIFVLIEGKIPKESNTHDRTARLFTETGLKVIFALLSNSELLNANYRTIADAANVSMGTIGWVLRELKDQLFCSEVNQYRTWNNKSRLIKKWAEEYPKLRSKNLVGRYYSADDGWWRLIDLEKYGAVFGGELAAISYSDHRIPRDGVLYVGRHKHNRLIRDLKLVESDFERTSLEDHSSSNIEIVTKFWGRVEDPSILHNVTHPLITYAELMDTWDPERREIAMQIAEKYFAD